MSDDSRVLPLALRVTEPFEPPSVNAELGPLIANPFGALWLSLSDSVAGLPLNTIVPGDALSPINNFRILGTAACLYAFDAFGSGNMEPVNSVPMSAASDNPTDPYNFVRGPTVAAIATVRDAAPAPGGTFLPVDRGDLDADALAIDRTAQLTAASLQAFNGATYDRLGTGSSTNLAAQSGTRALLASAPGEWTLTSAPAANTVATATRAAGAAGVRHVLRSIHASITAVAAIGAPLTVVVRDGATGVGAILWQDRLIAPVGTDNRISLTGLNIVGSAATAMTVEFTAVPGATNFETVSATGYSSAAQAA